jgi:hypothetical protein
MPQPITIVLVAMAAGLLPILVFCAACKIYGIRFPAERDEISKPLGYALLATANATMFGLWYNMHSGSPKYGTNWGLVAGGAVGTSCLVSIDLLRVWKEQKGEHKKSEVERDKPTLAKDTS